MMPRDDELHETELRVRWVRLTFADGSTKMQEVVVFPDETVSQAIERQLGVIISDSDIAKRLD